MRYRASIITDCTLKNNLSFKGYIEFRRISFEYTILFHVIFYNEGENFERITGWTKFQMYLKQYDSFSRATSEWTLFSGPVLPTVQSEEDQQIKK